jgi:hypothetical protein
MYPRGLRWAVTEAEWLACADPQAMLEFLLVGTARDRKLRLFAVACCRRKWKFFSDDRCRQAVDIAESFADDENMIGDLDWAAQGTRLALNEWRPKQGSRGILVRVSTGAHSLAQTRLHVIHIASELLGLPVDSARAKALEAEQQARLLRDIFGNPFRPVAFDPAWRTSDVLALARGIYDEKAFDRMPILADALQDAGCDATELLDHCRGTSPHVRGCWVVDLVLEKG